MTSLKELDRLTKSTQRREYVDGLVDIAYGFVILVIGLGGWFVTSSAGMTWLATALARYQQIAVIALVTLVALLVLAIFGLRRLITRIRLNYLWKGQGYVEPLRWQVRRSISVASVLIPVGMIFLGVVLLSRGILDEQDVLTVLVGSVSLGTAVTYFGMGIDLGIRRYVAGGIAGTVLSGLIMARSGSFSETWLLMGIVWMVILTASGLWALRQSVLTLAESAGE